MGRAIFQHAAVGCQGRLQGNGLVGNPNGHEHDDRAGDDRPEEVAFMDADGHGDEEADSRQVTEGQDLVARNDGCD